MIKTVKEKAARIGRQKIRCVITVRVSQLVFSNHGVLEPGSILTLCFEKSGRIATSNQILFDPSFDDVNPIVSQKHLKYTTIQVDEKLELAVSLYKNSDTNEYQVKRGKITIRQLQRNMTLGVDAFKVIGSHVLLLHEAVERLSSTPNSCIEDTLSMDGLPGSSLQVNISMKITHKKRGSFQLRKSIATLSKGALSGWGNNPHTGRKDAAGLGDEDETGSNASDNSDSSVFSTLGATFYYEDLEEYGGGRETTVTTLGGTASPQRLRQHQQAQEQSEISDYEAVYSDTNSFSRLQGKLPSRRSSGLHVMEVAMNEASNEHILPLPKPAPKRPSLPNHTSAQLPSTHHGAASSESLVHSQDPGGEYEHTGTSSTEHLLEASIPPSLTIPVAHTTHNATATVVVVEAPANENSSPKSPSARHLCRTPTATIAIPGQRHRESIGSRASIGNDWSPLLAGSLDHVSGGLSDRLALSAGKGGSRSSLSSPCGASHGKNRERLRSGSSTSGLSPLTPAQQQRHSSGSRRSSAHSPDAVEQYCTTTAATVGDNSVRTPTTPMAFSPDQELLLVHDAARQATEEAFRHYEQEVQARDERIAVLEKRLKESQETHRAELESTYASLHSAQAEAMLLRKELHEYEQSARAMKEIKESKLSQTSIEKESAEKEVGGVTSTTTESSHAIADSALLEDIDATNISIPSAESADADTATGNHSVPSTGTAHMYTHSADTAGAIGTTAEDNEPPSLHSIQEEDSNNSTEPEQHSVNDQMQEGISSPESVAVNDQMQDGISSPESVAVNDQMQEGISSPESVALLVSEFGRTSAEVHLLAQELAYYKQLASEAQRAKTEETLASREAATAVVQACMRRAESEQQLADAMLQIQELHRRLGQLQIEHDSEIRRSYALRARLQLYAEKLSAMEVDYTLSIHQLEESGIIKEDNETEVESL